MGDQTCKTVLAKGLLQIICLIGLLMPMAYIYVFTKDFDPFQRGFFCDDQNLKHPYKEQTVPISLCIAIWAFISIFFILIIESLRAYVEKDREGPIKNNRTPWIAIELYRHFGYFLLGCVSCLLFTEIAKYTIGRLRPHFLTVCDPDFTESLCRDPNHAEYTRFVTDEQSGICRLNGGEYTEKQLKEARLSFLSGHSSFSFFCGTFMIVYLQSRLNRFPKSQHLGIQAAVRSLKIARPFIQFGLIILAFWISLTRISDYFHHPMDVVTGALVGVLFACVTLVVIADIFNKPSTFRCDRGPVLPQRSDERNPTRPTRTSKSGRLHAPDIPLASAEDLKYIDEESQNNRAIRLTKI
jgi:phosphatidate phosphatase